MWCKNITCPIAMSYKKEKAPFSLSNDKPNDAPYFASRGHVYSCSHMRVKQQTFPLFPLPCHGPWQQKWKKQVFWLARQCCPISSHNDTVKCRLPFMRLQRRHRTGLPPVSLFTGPKRPTLIPQHSLRHTGWNCQYKTCYFLLFPFSSSSNWVRHWISNGLNAPHSPFLIIAIAVSWENACL